MKAFLIDVKECSGCYSCQIGCKDEHCGNDWTPYAKPQPDWGQFWGKINYYERGQAPQIKITHIFVPCQHCVNAPCIEACPVENGIYTRDDGLVIIDPLKCTGCQSCIDACPYECIYFNRDNQLAQKCTGCAHLIDRKAVYAPRCADNCPHAEDGALVFGEDSDLDLSNTEILHPEYNLTTRVHYKNLPKKFVAGTVYDPTSKEVIIGANCSMTGAAGTASATTDNFGDFWLEGLSDGEFTLTIIGSGKSKTITGDTTAGDIGLGDIALE
jgi:Fe-S-cluster-containing dehydrogenase component